jgi:predicted enzyme related to lactoylglutathione lyase
MPHGSFCWNELMTHDVGRAKRFYSDTIGWDYEPFPMPQGGTYWIATMNGTKVGGLFEMKEPEARDMPEQWVSYLAVDDVDRRIDRAVAAGATLCHPAFDIPAVGRIAMLRQPGGALISFMTPKPA